jgi:hypothetical protein
MEEYDSGLDDFFNEEPEEEVTEEVDETNEEEVEEPEVEETEDVEESESGSDGDEDVDEEEEETEEEGNEEAPEEEAESASDDGPSLSDLAQNIGRDLLSQKSEVVDHEAEARARQEADERYRSQFKLSVDDFDTELGAIELPEGDIEINGEKVNFKDIEKQAPGAVALTKALAVAISKKMLSQEIGSVRAELDSERFFNELSVFHPDARMIRDDDRFKEWQKTIPDETRALLNSNDILHVSLALDLFKEGLSQPDGKKSEKKKMSPSVKEKVKKVKKSKKLLKGSPKGKTKSKKRSGAYQPTDDSPEALEAFWDEDI